jgi:hypothetical protein
MPDACPADPFTLRERCKADANTPGTTVLRSESEGYHSSFAGVRFYATVPVP